MALNPEINTTFFRIFQETLTNVIRHAGATQVAVELKAASGQIILEVKDNGRGISRAEVTNTQSMGLLGMRERAGLLGGKFQISSLPHGKGTKVTVSVPLKGAAAELEGDNHENSFSRRSRSGAPRIETNSRR
jgi:signal transduction histidine kinase